jgi:putative phosphonate transport system ATP-binding protein
VSAPPLAPPTPVLTVQGLARRYGSGCAECEMRTGPEVGTSACSACGAVTALAGLDIAVTPGEVVGVVGESGSGKSTLLRLLHLDDEPTAGSAALAGAGELTAIRGAARTGLRAQRLAMVHQDPLAAGLRPALAAQTNVAERLLAQGQRRLEPIAQRAGAMLADMEVEAARHSAPLQTFSGGMRQRVGLARALVQPPTLLLLDEPTTGLDPSVQATVLDLLERAVARVTGATIVVSHDLGVVRLLADRVLVLRFGHVVEEGLADQVLAEPRHPYTRRLVASQLL